jgi:hypothetical protein
MMVQDGKAEIYCADRYDGKPGHHDMKSMMLQKAHGCSEHRVFLRKRYNQTGVAERETGVVADGLFIVSAGIISTGAK